MIFSTSTDDHPSKLQTSSPVRAGETHCQQKQHQNATPNHKQKLVPKQLTPSQKVKYHHYFLKFSCCNFGCPKVQCHVVDRLLQISLVGPLIREKRLYLQRQHKWIRMWNFWTQMFGSSLGKGFLMLWERKWLWLTCFEKIHGLCPALSFYLCHAIRDYTV